MLYYCKTISKKYSGVFYFHRMQIIYAVYLNLAPGLFTLKIQ